MPVGPCHPLDDAVPLGQHLMRRLRQPQSPQSDWLKRNKATNGK